MELGFRRSTKRRNLGSGVTVRVSPAGTLTLSLLRGFVAAASAGGREAVVVLVGGDDVEINLMLVFGSV